MLSLSLRLEVLGVGRANGSGQEVDCGGRAAGVSQQRVTSSSALLFPPALERVGRGPPRWGGKVFETTPSVAHPDVPQICLRRTFSQVSGHPDQTVIKQTVTALEAQNISTMVPISQVEKPEVWKKGLLASRPIPPRHQGPSLEALISVQPSPCALGEVPHFLQPTSPLLPG